MRYVRTGLPGGVRRRGWHGPNLARKRRQDAKLTRDDAHFLSVSFSADGSKLVTSGEEAPLRLWKVKTAAEERTLAGHQAGPSGKPEVPAVHFLPGAEQVASLATDGTVRSADAKTSRQFRRFDTQSPGWRLTVSDDGRLLATSHEDGIVRVWLLP